MKIESYKNLIVWQKSIDLVERIYLITEKFPKSEIYGLSSQMRRSAVSIPSNIAEGQQRNGIKEYIQFLGVASGSVAELETQIIIVNKLYPNLDFSHVNSLVIEIQKMLNALIKNLKNKTLQPLTLNLKPDEGFTMVELLVAMSLFLVTISIATGTFIQTLRGQRMTVAVISANNNAALAMEQLIREIRTGKDFSMENGDLLFTNSQGSQIAYHWNSNMEILEKSADGGLFKPLTADNVRVKRAVFRLFTGDPANPFPPRVTVLLGVGAAGLPFTSSVINLEMTVSGRVLQ